MKPIIKIDLEERIANGDPIIVELGCGNRKKNGRIGIDRLDLAGVDIVADLEKGLSFLPDNSVDEIHAISLFEHLVNFELLMSDIVRVLKKEGFCQVFVPHFSNPYFFSDYSHVRTFGLYTFFYFVREKDQLGRKVPTFYNDIRINIKSVKLVFRSPFRGRKIMKELFGALINSCHYLQEFYEENLCYLLPCYGIKISFSPSPHRKKI